MNISINASVSPLKLIPKNKVNRYQEKGKINLDACAQPISLYPKCCMKIVESMTVKNFTCHTSPVSPEGICRIKKKEKKKHFTYIYIHIFIHIKNICIHVIRGICVSSRPCSRY